DAAQYDLLHAPEAEETQTNRRGQKHHGHKIEGLCQQLIILQSITSGSQACAFGVVDIRRQLPERDGLGRGEAFSNLHRRQTGLEQESLAIRRRCSTGVKSGLFEPPVSRFEGRALGFNAVTEVAGGVETENAHAAQFEALLAARFGVDDRLAVLAALA